MIDLEEKLPGTRPNCKTILPLAVDFNHAIVELVRDEVVVGLVELTVVVGKYPTRNGGERSGGQEAENDIAPMKPMVLPPLD